MTIFQLENDHFLDFPVPQAFVWIDGWLGLGAASKAALAFAQHLLSRANFVQTFCKAVEMVNPDIMEQLVGKVGEHNSNNYGLW